MNNCPHCLTPVSDDDTIQEKDGIVGHARCKDLHDNRRRMAREPVEMLQRRIEAHVGGTIFYTMTPDRFQLDIPVEALANLSEDSHPRMLAMISEWIARHKPITINPVPK